MAKKEKFPQQLYVTRGFDLDGSLFFSAQESFESFAVVGDEVPVAVYRLVQVGKVKAKAELE